MVKITNNIISQEINYIKSTTVTNLLTVPSDKRYLITFIYNHNAYGGTQSLRINGKTLKKFGAIDIVFQNLLLDSNDIVSIVSTVNESFSEGGIIFIRGFEV